MNMNEIKLLTGYHDEAPDFMRITKFRINEAVIWLCIAFLLFTIAVTPVRAQFAGGSGTEEDPYQIATLEQLQAVGDSVNLDKHFVQIADIDAAETAGWHGGKGFVPIGSGNSIDNAFRGTFDGQGHVISNLRINRSEENYVGLFGYVRNSAVIHNVHLEQVKVHGRDWVGGLIGSGYGLFVGYSGTSGQVSGNNSVGGLVGWSESEIKKSYARTEVTGEEFVGGLVGFGLFSRSIFESYSTGNVIGEKYVGGLVGISHEGGIYKSFSTGNVKGHDIVGGLAGYSLGIYNSYATGDVTGNRTVGGLVGENGSSYTGEYGTITRSYATGKVTGDEWAGALIGSRITNIIRSYWSSQASGRDDWIGSGRGVSMDKIKAKLYDQGRHGQGAKPSTADMFGPPTIDLEDLTTDQMTGQNAWIFMHKLDFENTWQLTEGYPVLRWQEPADSLAPPQASILTIDPRGEVYEFEEVESGSQAIREFTLRNKGNIDMTGQVLLEDEGSGAFEIVSGVGPFELNPGSELMVEVVFSPPEANRYQGVLKIQHDAANLADPVEIGLKGREATYTSAMQYTDVPSELMLHQNYPNPFNPSTRIRFSLPEPAHVTVEVFDITGRHVATLVDQLMPAGEHAADFDAGGLSSGIYVYRISASGHTQTRRMTLIR
jgi:hypothetical protein